MSQRRDLSRFMIVAASVALVAAGQVALGADWPQFRGPGHDGISKETGLLTQWPDGGPEVLWRTKLGEGYSGLSIVGGRIYTMYGSGADEFAACLDASSGELLWRTRVDSKWKDGQGNGPRSTPTVEAGWVYVLSAGGMLYALRAEDGEPLWQHDLKKEYGAKIPQWGMSGSPVIEDNLLLVEVGSPDALMVAFNKKSGEEIWRSEGGKAGYSTPLTVTVNGVRQVIFFTAKQLYSVSPKDGSVLWKKDWKTSWDVNAAMPIFVPPDRLFISSGYDTGSALLKIKGAGEEVKFEEVWRNRDMKNQFSTSVLYDGHLYGFDNKILKCIDVETGAMKWRARDLGHGSLFYADGHLIVLGERGQLALIEATPKAYREKSKVQIFEGKTWTVPTLSGGKLYVRDEKELLSLAVSG